MLPFHPVCKLFPLLDDPALNGLAADIKANGLRVPIVVWQGQIVDGRNRSYACEKAGIEPDIEVIDGSEEEMIRRVVSLNLRRRHLDASQRSMLGTKLEKLLAEQAKKRQATSTGGATPQLVANLPQAGSKAREQAAAAVNVSPRLVQEAKRVEAKGVPALAEAVEAGEVSVSAAAQVAKLPRETQMEIVAAGPEAVKEAATEAREGVPVAELVAEVADLTARAAERKRTKLPPRNPSPEEKQRVADFSRVELIVKALAGYGLVANEAQRRETARVLFDPEAFHRHPAHRHYDHDEALQQLEEMGRGLVILFDEWREAKEKTA